MFKHFIISLLCVGFLCGCETTEYLDASSYVDYPIYSMASSKKERRMFTKSMRLKKYQEQNGKCAHCGRSFSFSEMEGDHIIPYSKGGKTTWDNLQMLCRKCNRTKGNRYLY